MFLAQGLDPATGAIGLIITLSSIGIFGFVAVTLVWWMLEGTITGGQGLAGLACCITAFAICIIAGSSLITGIVIIATISLVVTYPFASHKVAEIELSGFNIDLIDRAYQQLHERPDNIPAAFQLARSLYNFGFRGHAIAFSEQTFNNISTVVDPIKQTSLRSHFRNEEYELKNWKLATQDQKFFRPLACPTCKRPNPPGTIVCQACQAPYLLEIARQRDPRPRAMGKLVLAWGLICLIIPIAAFIGFSVPGFLAPIGATLLAVSAIGLILWRLFKPPLGQTTEVRTSA